MSKDTAKLLPKATAFRRAGKGQNPPRELQGVLWSCSVEKLDLWEDRAYIIHQILAFGTWSEWKWLFGAYPKKDIRKVFIQYPIKEYTRPAFNFAKNILLNLKKEELSLNKYARDISRHIGF